MSNIPYASQKIIAMIFPAEEIVFIFFDAYLSREIHCSFVYDV